MARYSEKKKAALDAMMRDEVYRVAREILTAEGLAGLTMDRIARKVGVSRGTLYNYFDDSDAVLIFVEDRTFSPVRDRVADIAASELAPEEKITAMTRTIFTALFEDRALVIAMFPHKETSGARHDHKKKQRCLALDSMQRVFREGMDGGCFRSVSPVLVSEIYLGAVVGLLESMMYNGEFRPPDEIVPDFVDFFVHGLRKSG